MPTLDTTPTPLCLADDATFWPWRTWADFAEQPKKAETTIIFPVIGFADWGLDAPLDIEETVALSVLRAALQRPEAPASRLLVLPPQRFMTGTHPSCAFAVDAPTAHATLEEWCLSVAASGFRRIVFFNSSPWNEELIDAAARDIRIEHGLQMFCVNVSALGLDFAPWRGGDRALLRQLIAELHGPESGGPTLEATSTRLARLFGEIDARPPLPRDGALLNLTR
ncbi:MAG: creatininase family protein [Burkholderiales bacterium]|nr:creatininase family protein [Opitutaceae bacterium]